VQSADEVGGRRIADRQSEGEQLARVHRADGHGEPAVEEAEHGERPERSGEPPEVEAQPEDAAERRHGEEPDQAGGHDLRPSSEAPPAVGRIRSSRTRVVVLLPAPFGPR
jgi:hypothetical protein